MRSPLPLLALSVLAATAALTGCGGSEDVGTAPVATGTTTAAAPTPTPSPTVDVARALRVTHTGGQISCADATAGRVEIGLWTNRLKATVPLTIESVRVADGGARVVGAVATTARKPRVSLAGVSDWPPTKMSADFDWAARTDLAGLHVDAGEEIVPVLHVVARPGSRLDAVEFTYSVDQGDIGSSVVARYGTKFSAKGC